MSQSAAQLRQYAFTRGIGGRFVHGFNGSDQFREARRLVREIARKACISIDQAREDLVRDYLASTL